MEVYRISGKKYSNNLSGLGAFLNGGRWNKKGQFALYTSLQISLSCLEVLVHLHPEIATPELDLVTIQVPDQSILEIDPTKLHKDWFRKNGIRKCREIGSSWINDNEHLTIKVPSSIIPQEFNYVINPQHELYREVRIIDITDFSLDDRLIKSNPIV